MIRALLVQFAIHADPRHRVDPARETNKTPAVPVHAVPARMAIAIHADPRHRVDPARETNKTPAVPVHAVLAREASGTREAPLRVDQAHR